MSISFANPTVNDASVRSLGRVLIPLLTGLVAYLIFLSLGEILLRDSDTLWQIRIGQWIVEHGAVPYTDVHTFTRFGEPWMSSSWLSQVLYAVSYESLGWAGPVILTSLAIGATVTIFMYLFADYLDPTRAILLVTLAVLESATHFLARPHMLAFPFMVAFLGGLLAAADRRSAPSWWLLPVLAIWANLHGGFVLGLALIGPIGLEALWTCERKDRIRLMIQWAMFGVAAVAACCCTPYGWNTLIGAAKILSLGKLLSMIWEWMPANFATWSFFEFTLLGLIGLGFYRGLSLSVPRIILLLGLLWMALSHSRNIEIFAFIVPLVVAKPFAEQLGTLRAAMVPAREGQSRAPVMLAALAVAVAGWASTQVFIAHHPFAFLSSQTPVAAVDVLQKRQAQRIFSTSPFGGYLLSRDIKAFIDGRAELYGEQFVLDYFDAVTAKDVNILLATLDKYQIDATLLGPDLPATRVLDHIAGWKRVYADDVAVIHVRDDQRKAAPPSAPSSSN
ncbi:hypothetical protein JQ634_31475 [Bradyrhizobium sp. AUGA SZCCT0240]|uniref:hypothetical protein n=1 Tax=unclassified Bradyrhizobium TaxID=2631580 RepID=UPI001BA4EF9E|nr:MULTISPECIES: hypothetical protein [unclassified Bradyrhizobium]MBR1200134.1 hypothetical protein [Bradyrhizobium sp. AUGA SZCCT0158]MBR1240458.1 hypothetical protein [Bradyrhizobium sp. AUGA SZCCT0274]MBR1258184.1 hypothetical protein [Bradyrhizobium sp. AUGA SZCCT0240]